MKFGLAAALMASVAMLGIAAPAKASVTWTWTLTGPTEGTANGSGTMVTDDESGGSFLITSFSGTYSPSLTQGPFSINGIMGVNTFPGNDNLILNGSPQLTEHGLAFTYADDSDEVTMNVDVNIFWADTSYAVINGDDTPGSGFTFIAQAPEPASLALLGAGLAGIGWSRRRKAG